MPDQGTGKKSKLEIWYQCILKNMDFNKPTYWQGKLRFSSLVIHHKTVVLETLVLGFQNQEYLP